MATGPKGERRPADVVTSAAPAAQRRAHSGREGLSRPAMSTKGTY